MGMISIMNMLAALKWVIKDQASVSPFQLPLRKDLVGMCTSMGMPKWSSLESTVIIRF